jgi:DNA-binding MarR family transcriptional regulator
MPPSKVHTNFFEESVIRSIRRITRAIDLYSKKLASTCELTGPQLAALRALTAEGSMSLTQLADCISLSLPTVSGIVDRLEARELVCRERQSDDKRRVLVRLTPTGRGIARRAPPALQESFSRKFHALPEQRQKALDEALKEIVMMLEADKLEASPLLMAAGEPARSTRTKSI